MQCYIAPEPYAPSLPVIECSKPNIYFKKYCKACLQCPLKCFSFTNWNYIQDAREAMRVVFFCTHKTYLYAQNEISYEYIQILF